MTDLWDSANTSLMKSTTKFNELTDKRLSDHIHILTFLNLEVGIFTVSYEKKRHRRQVKELILIY